MRELKNYKKQNKDLKNNSGNNKAYIKEIDNLKEELEILNTGNKRLEAEKIFYITQAKESGEKREKIEKEKEYYRNDALSWTESYYKEREKNKIIRDFNIFLSFVIVLEVILIAMLIWK